MKILFGHPGGNPNSHHAGLSHFERGRLAAFCVPWMPRRETVAALQAIPGLRGWAGRLERRCFEPLREAPKIQCRTGEWWRMLRRMRDRRADTVALSYEANDWLMRTMARECRRGEVTSVHAYEDCSLLQFREARRLGKTCVYDMPIGYFGYWQRVEADLALRFRDWLPEGGLPQARHVRPQQKEEEMAIADVVLAPSSFVRRTILEFVEKPVHVAPYGVDLDMWAPGDAPDGTDRPLRFLFAGQLSVRKGVPLLLDAWRVARRGDAELWMAGSWHLASERRRDLPSGVRHLGALSSADLRQAYRACDVLVLPSFFEGQALVLGQAVASGLAVVASRASGVEEIIDGRCGVVLSELTIDCLAGVIGDLAADRARVMAMKAAARERARHLTWDQYRRRVADAVDAAHSKGPI